MALDTANSLIATTEMLTALGTTSAESSRVNDMINAASWFANQYADRVLKARTLTPPGEECYYGGEGGSELYLRQYPVIAISALYTDENREWSSDTLVDATTYAISLRRVLVLDAGVYPSWPRSVRVQYRAGYETVPYDLKMSCMELVQFWYGRENSKRVGKTSVGIEGESTAYEKDIPKAVLDVLDNYKRVQPWGA